MTHNLCFECLRREHVRFCDERKGAQAESAQLLKKVMSALRVEPDKASDIQKRKSLVASLLDSPGKEIETKILKDEEAPPPSASNKKPRSKFR